MTERVIATILSARFVGKAGKYIVRLAFPDEKAEDVWMTARQASALEALLEQTPKGWSTRRRTVIGVWDDRGFYAYSRLVRDDSPHFPPDYNLTDLEDDL